MPTGRSDHLHRHSTRHLNFTAHSLHGTLDKLLAMEIRHTSSLLNEYERLSIMDTALPDMVMRLILDHPFSADLIFIKVLQYKTEKVLVSIQSTIIIVS